MAKDIVLSKVFGPTDSVADTLTTIGSAYQFPAEGPGWTIEEIQVSKGNVVNAKECAGFIVVDAPGISGSPFAFAYGNGAGGATNSSNKAAEQISCQIGVGPNQQVTMKVLDAEIAKDVTVSIGCSAGKKPSMFTLAAGGAGQDSTADAALTLTVNAKLLGANLTPFRDGILRQVRFAGSGVVDAKAGSGKLVIEINGYKWPVEFAVGSGPGGATLGAHADADVINNLAIPLKASSAIVVKLTSAEIVLSASASLQVQ